MTYESNIHNFRKNKCLIDNCYCEESQLQTKKVKKYDIKIMKIVKEIKHK